MSQQRTNSIAVLYYLLNARTFFFRHPERSLSPTRGSSNWGSLFSVANPGPENFRYLSTSSYGVQSDLSPLPTQFDSNTSSPPISVVPQGFTRIGLGDQASFARSLPTARSETVDLVVADAASVMSVCISLLFAEIGVGHLFEAFGP